ncbi:avidin-like isoform X2 [Anas acuta]|uniref:avidin-like isoform X2 n=1 Tax=Anas acuta TaxID=28680 RepID=UPI0035C8F2FF
MVEPPRLHNPTPDRAATCSPVAIKRRGSPARSTDTCPPAAEMVPTTSLLLLLGLALLAPGLSADQCVLTGNWTNDLGSNMTIGKLSNGEFAGTYHTAVTTTKKEIKISPLVGTQHSNTQPTFGFTVNWNFTDSTTVFTGQCFVDEHGKETLKTMWLLRSHVDSIEDDWKATMVGTNTFTRLHTHLE